MINNQQIVENRRNWKGQVVDYDAIQAYENRECTYCLTDAQVAVLAGIIEPLAWATRWQSDSQAIDPLWTEQFRNDIQRRLAMGCCGDNVLYRYTEDGTLESSEDGGVTWEPAPQDDIRQTATIFPPVPGEPSNDKKCIAATGMTLLIRSQIGENLTDDMGRYALDELIRDWTQTYIGTSNPFQAILTVVVNQIFALSIALIRAALTDTVYDTLTCIFLCRIADDLSFNEGQKANVINDIGEQIGGIATLFLQQLINLLGPRGLTNLARSYGAAEGDCDDCDDCPTPCPEHWHIYAPESGHFGEILEVGEGYLIAQTTGINTNNNYYIYLVTDNPDDCCYLNSYEILEGTCAVFAASCGQAIGAPLYVTGGEICVDQLQPQSTGPFKIKFILSDCP